MAQGARHVIDDVATIDLLASSARMEIVDALEASTGALSVAALAARLGRPADGLYYHLRQLVAAGLVREQADAGVRTYRIATLRGKGLRLRYQPGRPRMRVRWRARWRACCGSRRRTSPPPWRIRPAWSRVLDASCGPGA